MSRLLHIEKNKEFKEFIKNTNGERDLMKAEFLKESEEKLTRISRVVVCARVFNITHKSYCRSHILVNIALSLWTYYGIICKFFPCALLSISAFYHSFREKITLVECGIRVLKSFTFFVYLPWGKEILQRVAPRAPSCYLWYTL